jgi:hypothetical protein
MRRPLAHQAVAGRYKQSLRRSKLYRSIVEMYLLFALLQKAEYMTFVGHFGFYRFFVGFLFILNDQVWNNRACVIQ